MNQLPVTPGDLFKILNMCPYGSEFSGSFWFMIETIKEYKYVRINEGELFIAISITSSRKSEFFNSTYKLTFIRVEKPYNILSVNIDSGGVISPSYKHYVQTTSH